MPPRSARDLRERRHRLAANHEPSRTDTWSHIRPLDPAPALAGCPRPRPCGPVRRAVRCDGVIFSPSFPSFRAEHERVNRLFPRLHVRDELEPIAEHRFQFVQQRAVSARRRAGAFDVEAVVEQPLRSADNLVVLKLIQAIRTIMPSGTFSACHPPLAAGSMR